MSVVGTTALLMLAAALAAGPAFADGTDSAFETFGCVTAKLQGGAGEPGESGVVHGRRVSRVQEAQGGGGAVSVAWPFGPRPPAPAAARP